MEYKTILVHLDDTDAASARVPFAASLAARHRAHLVGLAHTGILQFFYQTTLPEGDLVGMAPLFAQLRQDAEERARRFEAQATHAGVASIEHRIVDEDAAVSLAQAAMYADLLVAGQSEAGAPDIDYVALHAPAPVLLLPRGLAAPPVFERVLVAWNASPEAARAVRMALPFLQEASHVEVAVFGHQLDEARQRAGGTELARFLARHGVAANVERHAADDVGDALLALAGEHGAQLLVLGCYGHSRFRETLLGGVSRTVLRHAQLPTLLAH